jgi:homogentisate 1,2-dioxygenase
MYGIATKRSWRHVSRGEIIGVPRVIALTTPAGRMVRRYVRENDDAMQRLPEPGLSGANGLANPLDFGASVARFERRREPTGLAQRFKR